MQITITVPQEPFLAEPRESVSRKIRLYAALGMYRARELSIGAACELAGVDRYTFLEFCKRQDAGVDGDAWRISQFVWILFLKIFDHNDVSTSSTSPTPLPSRSGCSMHRTAVLGEP